MNAGFLNISWFVWSGLSLGVALVFVGFVPNADKIHATTGLQRVILRWFHSLTWLLLALSFAMRGIPNETLNTWANPVGLAGGIVYAIFLVSFVRL